MRVSRTSIVAPIFANDPDAVAISVAGRPITFSRLRADVDALAFWLAGEGVGRGTRLGIRPRHDASYWAWVAHLAALRLGACHATVGPASGTLQAAVDIGLDLCLSFIRGTERFAPGLHCLDIAPKGLTPLTDQLGIEPRPWEDVEAEAHASRLAFTSGTTGTPRGLLWTPEIIRHRVDQAARNAQIGAATRLHVALGMLTTAGFRYPLAVLRAGGCLLRPGGAGEVDQSRPEVALDSNLLIASPVNLRNHLVRLGGRWRGHEARTILVLGGRLPLALRDEALARACTRIEVNYGSTETGGVATGDAALLDRNPGAVGFPGEGVEVEVIDEKGRALPAGSEGILRIRTDGMCDGYAGPAASADPALGFRGGWFYPGDLAIGYEDGLLAIVGRTSQVVNVAGVKVPTAELEERIAARPGVRGICVVPVTLRQGDMLAIVVVTAKEVDLASLHKEIKRALPLNCPFRLLTAKGLPRNAMGKLQRRQVAERVTPLLQRKVDDEGDGGNRPVRRQ